MKKTKKTYFYWSLAFILVGVLIRLINLNMPLLEGAITRQLQTAVITLNLLENGFDFLHPQINHLPEPRYYIMEPPLLNAIVAFLYKIFGVKEYIGRLVSIFACAGAGYFIFQIASRNLNDSIARVAVFVFTFSPLSLIYTRAFQPDTLALFFSVALFYYFIEWVNGDEKKYPAICAIGSLAFFIKPTYAFLLLTLLLFGLHQRGKKSLLDPKVYFLAAIIVIPSVLWILHAREMIRLYPSPVWFESMDVTFWFTPDNFLKYDFYKNIFQWMSGLILTPVGFTLFLLGLFVKSNKDGDFLINAWLLGVLSYYFLLPFHAYTHEYYHLAFLPVGSLVIGKAWWFLFERQSPGENGFYRKPFRYMASFTVIAMVYGYSNSGFKVPASLSQFSEEKVILNKYTKNHDRIVADGIYLYYGNRKGWELSYDSPYYERQTKFWIAEGNQLPPYTNLIEAWRKQGAAYFFETRTQQFSRHKEFADYMLTHYPVVARKKGMYILFDLKQQIEHANLLPNEQKEIRQP